MPGFDGGPAARDPLAGAAQAGALPAPSLEIPVEAAVDHRPRIQVAAGATAAGAEVEKRFATPRCRRSTESRRRKAYGVESATARPPSARAMTSARTRLPSAPVQKTKIRRAGWFS